MTEHPYDPYEPATPRQYDSPLRRRLAASEDPGFYASLRKRRAPFGGWSDDPCNFDDGYGYGWGWRHGYSNAGFTIRLLIFILALIVQSARHGCASLTLPEHNGRNIGGVFDASNQPPDTMPTPVEAPPLDESAPRTVELQKE
ncbi:MAG: hypothetical protein ABI743_05980 [bacterium]